MKQLYTSNFLPAKTFPMVSHGVHINFVKMPL